MDAGAILSNILSPAFLFFFLGFGAVLLKSDLEIPHPLPKFFSLYLLLCIGYTGGEKLAHAGLSWSVGLYILGGVFMALAIPLYTFFILRRMLSVYDAAAMAATFGSISIVTFIVGREFLTRLSEPFGGYMVALMSLMESPAIIMGILLVRIFAPKKDGSPERPGIGHLLRESFLNGTVYLLLGSLVVGFLTGNSAGKSLEPFTTGIFKGMVLFFLLDTGMLAARRAATLKKAGFRLVLFGVLAPLANGMFGVLLAWAMGMNRGDALLFVLLCASSSYIVAPAAMRQAVPEANPGLFELLSLSVTFPFNISIGIPLYWSAIRFLIG